MTKKSTTMQLKRLWGHIGRHRRLQFGGLLVLMIFASFAEIISIGIVIPFLAILTDPNRVFSYPETRSLIQALGITRPEKLLLLLTIAFGLAVIVAASLRLLLLWASTRLSYATGADFSSSIYHRTLYQPYLIHVSRNSSEVINGISGKTGTAIVAINLTVGLISSCIILFSVLVVFISINPYIAIASFACFGLIYILIVRLTRNKLLINSNIVAYESTYVIKSLQEGLGGIRDILIDGNQLAYCEKYRSADRRLRRAQGNNIFISSAPRFVLEAIGMLLIALVAYFLAIQPDGIERAIPILGALTLGAQKVLPLLQQVYSSWTSIQGSYSSLQDTLEFLEQPLPYLQDERTPFELQFKQDIKLKELSFRYNEQAPWVFENINLTITKYSKIGIIGETGSGKSTLMDIIMGLMHPTSGNIEIDGKSIRLVNNRAWQTKLAHVPQSIFLTDSSIEENIAFGIPKHQIDHIRVKKAAQQAQLAEIINTWPNQYQTLVGERGVRLSGGQRQRIGIARAIYKKAEVIIFDEATSALDSDTEVEVMKAIEEISHNHTIIIIAHRITTLKHCTQIIELNREGVKCHGDYLEFINKNM